MRVIHFRRLYSLLSEVFVHDTVTAMARSEGIDSRVLCLIRLRERTRPAPCTTILRAPEGLARWAHRLPGTRRLWESDTVLWPLVRKVLAFQLARLEPDVVLAHFGPDGFLVEPAAREVGVPLAVGFYGYDVSSLVQRFGKRWRKRYARLFERAALLVAISSHVAERLLDLGAPPEKLRVLPLGVSLERFPWSDRAASWNEGPVHCIHVGRLTAKKSPVRLVQAFASARQRLSNRVDLRLTIVGDGEERGATQREIARCGVEPWVTLTGAVAHDEIPALLAGSQIYVQHCMVGPDGDQEGQGVVFVEASASGLPIVTTDHLGIRDVVEHGVTGWVSSEGDVAAMGSNLARLALDPSLWTDFGRRGRELVAQRFALNDRVRDLVEALRGCTGRGDRLLPSPTGRRSPARGGEPVPTPSVFDPRRRRRVSPSRAPTTR